MALTVNTKAFSSSEFELRQPGGVTAVIKTPNGFLRHGYYM